MTELLDKIRENRARPEAAPRHNYCPAYHGHCPDGCFLREHCERDPEGVRELVERLDEETLDALGRIACGER